jgi:hypothetical protein
MKTRFGAKDSLITNELGSVHQADSRKSRFDSVPLKGQNMANAKYLRKRIALVAAAALGVGMLAAAPAFATASAVAATTTTGTVTGATLVSGTTYTVPANTAVTVPIKITTSAGLTASSITTFTGTITTNTVIGAAPAITASVASNALPTTDAVMSVGGSTTLVATAPVSAGAADAAVQIGTMAFTPLNPGVYSIVVANDSTSSVASAALTFYVGTQIDSTDANTAFAVQGSNVNSSLNLSSGTVLTGAPNGQATARFTNFATTTHYYVTVSGGTLNAVTTQSGGTRISKQPASGTPALGYNLTNGSNLTGGVDFYTVASNANDALDVQVTAASGTVTIKVSTVNSQTGLSTTFSTTGVTFTAASGISAGYSTVALADTSTNGADTAGLSYDKSTTTVADANVLVTLKDTTGTSLASGYTVAGVVTGSGLILASSGTSASVGTLRSSSATIDGSGRVTFGITADGTAGTFTITLTATNTATGVVTALGTRTLTFTGSVASIKVISQNYSVIKPGGTLGITTGLSSSSVSPAVTVEALDANGNAVAGKTITGLSSNTLVIATATAVEDTTTPDPTGYYGGPGYYNSAVTASGVATSGQTATVTYRYTADSGVTYISATPVTFTIGNSAAATVTVTLDAATYAPGAKAKVTITAKDSAGNPVADNSGTGFFTAAMSSTVALSGSLSLPGPDVAFANGVATKTFYVPAAAGDFTISGTLGTGVATALQGTAVSAKATVTGGTGGGLSAADAAAIAAAKAAAEAATAAVAALSTTVASLVASITAQIRALSAMIQKLLGRSGGSTPGLPKTGKKH